MLLTVRNALEIIIGLSHIQICPNEFIIDLVLHVGKENEGGDNTLSSTCLELGLYISVPHIRRACQQCSHSAGSHCQQYISPILDRSPTGDPVRL
jgi:hypothetical protein